MSDSFTLENRGGRAVSLMNVSFQEGDQEYYNIKLYEVDPRILWSNRELSLPVDIDAGKGKVLSLRATHVSGYGAIEDALSAINYPDPQARDLPETQKPSSWTFEFSDGTTVVYKYQEGWYHIQPAIDRTLQQTCNP